MSFRFRCLDERHALLPSDVWPRSQKGAHVHEVIMQQTCSSHNRNEPVAVSQLSMLPEVSYGMTSENWQSGFSEILRFKAVEFRDFFDSHVKILLEGSDGLVRLAWASRQIYPFSEELGLEMPGVCLHPDDRSRALISQGQRSFGPSAPGCGPDEN